MLANRHEKPARKERLKFNLKYMFAQVIRRGTNLVVLFH